MHKLKTVFTAAVFMLSLFAVQAQTPTPGGVNNANYTWQVWLTPDSYDSSTGVWTNKITGAGSVGNFYAPVLKPAKVNRGYNFHPSVEFTKPTNEDASKRLKTYDSVVIASNQNVTSIFVYKRANTTSRDYLFSFNDSDSNGDLVFYENNSNNLRLYWPGSNRGTTLTAYEGIITVDNANMASNEVISYINGVSQGSRNTAAAAYNSPWAIGANGSGALSSERGRYGYEGIIQEIIILKASGTDNHIGTGDLQKIHSYLALKYGISMNNTGHYLASDGTVIWDTIANAGYNQYIFGIGRDDATCLYQKESVSRFNDQTTLFLGTKLETLNDKNTAAFNANKQYLVLGSNGVTSILSANIEKGRNYKNGYIDAPDDLNFQSGIIYKAQLTNLPKIQVSVKVKMDYLYAFVSKDANFLPSQTKIYPVSTATKTAAIEIDTDYKYIRFAGYSPGPGGVNANLRLWLHADDESLDIETLPLSDSKLANYPYPVSNNETPAVNSWTDHMRGQSYSWNAGENTAAHRIPVYEPDNLMMNFHPSVRFWGSGSSYGSYLSNPNGILSTARPANEQQTAYFVTSNNFSTGNSWIYAMIFGSTSIGGGNSYRGPGYGIQQSTDAATRGNLVGRFRTSAWEGRGSANLFNIGATSINGYYQNGTAVKFRFNGKEDNATNALSWGNFSMANPSMLGPGWSYDRTLIGVMSEVIIFEKALSPVEQQALESYLAIKYGVTLRPSNTSTNRFDYVLSSGKTFWYGNKELTDRTYGKYATFYNNVAAVIRDDAARLHNMQSHSTDAGSILHMGVAGKKLGKNFDVGELSYDQEVVVWGANDEEGTTVVAKLPCAGFNAIFNKKWMVRKISEGNRPIKMLVGAENNKWNNLGLEVGAAIKSMYDSLDGGLNDVSLIVADSPEKLTPGHRDYGQFKAVVPMDYIDGEHQCIYTFTDEIVYITFGYKPNNRGCSSDVEFHGRKTYNWSTQWTRMNYNFNGQLKKTITKPAVDLGDDLKVTTEVTYDNTVRANTNYPRFTNSPRNALNIRRRNGTVGVSKVTTTITFSSPVIPDFFISGIDSRSRQYDAVTISASCPGGPVAPVLMREATERNATFVIQGRKALGNKNRSAGAAAANGKLNVTFRSGITQLVIEYVIEGRIGWGAQDIFIGPLSLRSVPAPPAFNEDGISFTKRVKDNDISTCEPVEYTFRIGNANTDGARYVNFTDVLPEKMTWLAESAGFDSNSAENNVDVKFNKYGGTRTLKIDSLLVPCTGEVIFKAVAHLDQNAPSGTYDNHATIDYKQRVGGSSYVLLSRTLDSEDEDTQDPLTVFDATRTVQKAAMTMEATASPAQYGENSEITVTLKITNPNEEIKDMYVDLNWDAGFRYVASSWKRATNNTFVIPDGDLAMSIAGATDGSSGFTLPNGKTVFTFKLLAPNAANLEYELDNQGNPMAKKAALNISYELSTGAKIDSPCLEESMKELSGTLTTPFMRSHIIVNKHSTIKIAK